MYLPALLTEAGLLIYPHRSDKKTMTLETDYGIVEYEADSLITFADGLFGFPDLKNYLLLTLDEEDDSTLLMQSVEDQNVGFALINPYYLCPDYNPQLTWEELSCLNAKENGELSYYTICTIHSNYLENTVNLKCPLVINPNTRQGMQVILADSPYECRHTLGSFPSVADSANTDEGSDKHADSAAQKK